MSAPPEGRKSWEEGEELCHFITRALACLIGGMTTTGRTGFEFGGELKEFAGPQGMRSFRKCSSHSIAGSLVHLPTFEMSGLPKLRPSEILILTARLLYFKSCVKKTKTADAANLVGRVY